MTTADGMELGYNHLVIATGSVPEAAPVAGSGHCLSYSSIDDAAGNGGFGSGTQRHGNSVS
ncbi:hypothetical protein [Arthrobacter sp. UYCo732]|uniref:hypothetical protein n=1 Tax=Arthrobacter sp. UYCo732 TaxID=3156336 RepID=UPI0033909DA4